jgi:hypothetical protein
MDAKDDRRGNPRFPQHFKVRIFELPLVGASKGRKPSMITGHIHNISRGGLCVITARSLTNCALVRCEVALGEEPVHIGTLAQVRWTQPGKLPSDRYISGLSFLI